MKVSTSTLIRSIPLAAAIALCGALPVSALAAGPEVAKPGPGEVVPAMDEPRFRLTIDSELPSYKPSKEFKGVLISQGSETFGSAMKNLLNGFKKFHPGVKTKSEKSEWTLGVLNVGDGYAQLMPAVRELTEGEKVPFTARFSREPFGIKMSKTMWNEPGRTHPYGIFVHKDNPLKAITVEQAAWAFFKHYPGSSPTSQPLTKWGQLGLPESWKDKVIHSYGDMEEHALADNFKYIMSQLVGFPLQWREGDPYFGGGYVGQIDEKYVAMMCREDVEAICWTGVPIGKEYGLKLLAMPSMDGKGWTDCSLQDYVDGKWPITRHTYMYVNKPPGKGIDPLTKEFLTYMLSKDGQRAILDAGYLPLTAAEAKTELAKLQ